MSLQQPKVGFVSLGCPKALVDSERILTQLKVEGYDLVQTYDDADVVVVNTCGFIDSAVAESLDTIGEALAENGIRLRVIGALDAFDSTIQGLIQEAHDKTSEGQVLTLTISANYGGRWDILNAMNDLLAHRKANGLAADAPVSEDDLKPFLQLSDLPEPDLFIRTGGEARVSNFLLWQLAYTELFFTPIYWPDFNKSELLSAIASYQQRERRFGRTSAQVASQN